MSDVLTMELPPEADSAKRRQIIEGARTVFLAHGFDAASMGEIARKAGVSKGTLYVYFKNKEELFEAIAEQQCHFQAERVFALDPADHDVAAALGKLGLGVTPSQGNFVLVDLGRPARGVFDALLRRGVIVRPVASYGLPNHLRITVGTPGENQRLLATLAEVL